MITARLIERRAVKDFILLLSNSFIPVVGKGPRFKTLALFLRSLFYRIAGVQDGGSLAGNDSSEALSTLSRSHAAFLGRLRGPWAVDVIFPVSINSLNRRRSLMMVLSGALPNIRAIIAPT